MKPTGNHLPSSIHTVKSLEYYIIMYFFHQTEPWTPPQRTQGQSRSSFLVQLWICCQSNEDAGDTDTGFNIYLNLIMNIVFILNCTNWVRTIAVLSGNWCTASEKECDYGWGYEQEEDTGTNGSGTVTQIAFTAIHGVCTQQLALAALSNYVVTCKKWWENPQTPVYTTCQHVIATRRSVNKYIM